MLPGRLDNAPIHPNARPRSGVFPHCTEARIHVLYPPAVILTGLWCRFGSLQALNRIRRPAGSLLPSAISFKQSDLLRLDVRKLVFVAAPLLGPGQPPIKRAPRHVGPYRGLIDRIFWCHRSSPRTLISCVRAGCARPVLMIYFIRRQWYTHHLIA